MRKTFKKYFIPHEENQFKPHFLREASVFTVVTVLLLLFVFSGLYPQILTRSGLLALILPDVLVDLANASRIENDLPALTPNALLLTAAELKASDMAGKSYFAHTSPEGLTPWHWFDLAGYEFIYAGENLAVNFTNSEPTHRAWMNSPGHRANILGEHFTEIGIATKDGYFQGRPTTFVVQTFGQPLVAAASVPTSPTKQSPAGTPKPKVEESVPSLPTVSPEATDRAQVSPQSPAVTSPPVVEVLRTETAEELFIAVRNEDAISAADAIPKTTSETPVPVRSYSSWIERFLVNPHPAFLSAYFAIAALIAFALVALIFTEIRRQHPIHMVYGILLLLLVGILLYLDQSLWISDIIVT